MKSFCASGVAVLLSLLLLLFFRWVGGSLEDERRALLLIRDSFPAHDTPYQVSITWKGEDYCKWGGIICSYSTGHVVGIYFASTKWYANSTLFADFKQLEELSLFDAGINNVAEIFNVTCQLKHLRALDLDRNHMGGSIPSCLCDCYFLEFLSLSSNQLKGNIPFCIGNMKNLQNLDLSSNLLEGNVPSSLSNLNSLQFLYLYENQLDGFISSIFPNLTMISYIAISSNRFSGEFSFSVLANLSMLTVIDLSHNVQLQVNTESTTWVPSFQLNFLGLENCNLNSQTNAMPSFISMQYSLITLILSHNSLEGTIPNWLLCNRSTATLLRGNMLVGPLPSCSPQKHSSSELWLDVSHNHFNGPLSANNEYFLSCNLTFLNMSSNALDGEIPKSMIFMKNSLFELDLSNNNLSGEMPHWLTANNSKLGALILSNNKLQGEVLSEDSNMTKLRVLFLNGNNFTGSIPASLINSRDLEVLDIGENNLSGHISNWYPMPLHVKVLLLGHNNLQGYIPSHLCFLQELRYLDLSSNNFSGDIPLCFSNITTMVNNSFESEWENIKYFFNVSLYVSDVPNGIDFNTKSASYNFQGKPLRVMKGIDFSFNKLTGTIPTEIGYLKGLHSLNLSHNHLDGPIPCSFQYLKSLESLDLSYNQINGTIPPEMARLDSLGVFNVSFNNLSGEIPSHGHFSTLNDPTSYMGNPRLCGRDLKKHCSSPNNTPSVVQDKDEDDKKYTIMDSNLFFYSCVSISYALGFWGAIALLIFKKTWRWKLFKFVDALFDWCSDKLWAFRFYLKNHIHTS